MGNRYRLLRFSFIHIGPRGVWPKKPINKAMKKLCKLALGCVLAVMATSCAMTTPVTATSNPVGNKCGVAKTNRILMVFGGSADCGINKAAKNGGITRISHIDSFEKSYLGIFSVYGVRVYGE